MVRGNGVVHFAIARHIAVQTGFRRRNVAFLMLKLLVSRQPHDVLWLASAHIFAEQALTRGSSKKVRTYCEVNRKNDGRSVSVGVILKFGQYVHTSQC